MLPFAACATEFTGRCVRAASYGHTATEDSPSKAGSIVFDSTGVLLGVLRGVFSGVLGAGGQES